MFRTYMLRSTLVAFVLCAGTAAMAQTPVVKVTHDGVGPINKDLPIGNVAKLRHIFKGCHVAASTRLLDHKPTEKVVEVMCHGKPAYTLRTGHDLGSIVSAEVRRPGAQSPEGITLGMTMADVYKLGQVDCDADVNPSVVRCVFLGDTTVAYSAQDTTPQSNGLLPPDDQIKRLKITGIIWRANMM